MNNQSVTDLSYLQEVAMGDMEIVIATTEVFIGDIPDSLTLMQAYFENRQWDELGELAHKIKPNFTYMGMKQARELIVKIEKQAKRGAISGDLEGEIKEFIMLCRKGVEELTVKINAMKTT